MCAITAWKSTENFKREPRRREKESDVEAREREGRVRIERERNRGMKTNFKTN